MAGEQNIQSAVLTDRRPQISELAQKTQPLFSLHFFKISNMCKKIVFFNHPGQLVWYKQPRHMTFLAKL